MRIAPDPEWIRRAACPALTLLMLAVVAGCRPDVRSNFDVAQWEGYPLELALNRQSAPVAASQARPLRLAALESPGLVLNVYSPTCGPCIDELPALNLLYARARELGIPMFLVATARPGDHGLELDAGAPWAERFAAIATRLAQDIRKYDIQVPVLVMADGFQVAPSGSLVTGTPETLFFRQTPLVLEYNFIGPISAAESPGQIESESRYAFALRILSRIRSEASAPGSESATGYTDSDRPRL
jgi:thiol-disulfide isomerase/thioredoxin